MRHRHHHMAWGALGLLLVLDLACGGTKVVNQQKTVLHGADMINVTNVVRITSRIEGTLPGGETVDMAGMDRTSLEKLVGTHGPLAVRSIISFDDQEMTYEARQVGTFSELRKLRKNLESAMKKIQRFMKSDSRQLKL